MARPSKQQPTVRPRRLPSSQPSKQPSSQPSDQPATRPRSRPSSQPSRQPLAGPSSQPSIQPRTRPSSQPSRRHLPSHPSNPSPGSLLSHHPCQADSPLLDLLVHPPTGQPRPPPSSQQTIKPTAGPSCSAQNSSADPAEQTAICPAIQATNLPDHCSAIVPASLTTHCPTCRSTPLLCPDQALSRQAA
jgi:hypothetical protein